jgi:Zn-dependent protease with chaperone function
MTNPGLVLLLSSGTMAVAGVALFLMSRHSVRTSQGASLALFFHGAFATSALLFVVSLVHVHSLWPLDIRFHSLSQALMDDFDCDLSLDCVATTAVLIAGIVLGASMLLGQVSSRALLHQCQQRRVMDRVDLPRDTVPPSTEVWLVREDRPDAFAVALLRLDPRTVLRVQDVIVVTTGFRDLLTPAELRAALAHEAAHVKAHDHRYLPFVRSLSKVLFMDPVLGYLARHLAARYEFGADEDAAWATRDPRALARALLKVHDAAKPSAGATAFLGHERSPMIVERIERLLDLADRMGLSP